MQIRPTAFTIGLIIHSFITLFFVYTEFGIGSLQPPNSEFDTNSFDPIRLATTAKSNAVTVKTITNFIPATSSFPVMT